jgi:hypothetical protein
MKALERFPSSGLVGSSDQYAHAEVSQQLLYFNLGGLKFLNFK